MAVELDGLAAHIGLAARGNALLCHSAERTLVQALGFRGRKAVRARIQREIVDRDDVFLHRDARAVVVVHKRFGESESVGHHHVLEQRVDLRVGIVAVVAVAVVAEVGKAVLGHLGAHIHRVDHFLGEAEFGLDRAAAVKLKRRIGDLAHAAAQKDGQHAHYQRRGEKLFHGVSLLW